MIEDRAIIVAVGGPLLFLVLVLAFTFVSVRKQLRLNDASRARTGSPCAGPPEDTYAPVPKTPGQTVTRWRVDVTIHLEGKYTETLGWKTSGCVSEEDARDSHLLVSLLNWFNNEPDSASYVAAVGTTTDFVLVRSTIRWVRIEYSSYEEQVDD